VTLTVFLHNLKELNDDFGRRADQHLALSSLLCMGDVLETVVEDANKHHCVCICLKGGE